MGEPGAVEGPADRLGLVGAEVVHDHERVGPLAQRRDQDLLGEGEEDRRAGRGGDAPARDQAVERERADHGQPLPPPPGHLAHGALSPGGAGVGPRHAGVDAGLVDEDQAGGIDAGQLGPPRRPRLGHVLPVPLGGLERLFFRDQAERPQRPAQGRGAAPDARCARPAGRRTRRAWRRSAPPPGRPAPPARRRRAPGRRGAAWESGAPPRGRSRSQPESVRSPTR